MRIKPVLVPDHDAASLRKLMDHFAEASTGPTRKQLTESRAAVAAAPGVAESDPLANRDAYAKQHQQGQVYKTHYPKGENPFHKAGMKDKRSTKMSAYDISNTGPKGVLPESDVAEGVLGDIGSEIGHGVKGLKRTIQGKPSRQDVKDKYRDRSDAAYKAGDRKDAKKNADRWERVHNTTNSGMMEEDSAVKYGVFAKGGSVGSQRFRDDPLKTFDSREEAVADARRRRSGLSKGERGYYRMGYVVKPIKGEVEEGMIDNIKNTVRAANYDRLARRSNSQAVAGGGFAPPAQFKSLSAKGDQRAQKAQDIRKGSAEQVDEKSEAIRHGNNSRSIYHVDEGVDPIEQLRADIRRFAQ